MKKEDREFLVSLVTNYETGATPRFDGNHAQTISRLIGTGYVNETAFNYEYFFSGGPWYSQKSSTFPLTEEGQTELDKTPVERLRDTRRVRGFLLSGRGVGWIISLLVAILSLIALL